MAVSLPRADPRMIERFADALGVGAFGCTLKPYQKIGVKPISVSGEMIAYASPDSTYFVTKSLLDGAHKSILIGIYDFTATYVKDWLLKALQRGVKVSLMLDLDGRTGETPIFDELRTFGVECVPAPSCNSTRVHFFSVSHEKVIVVDDTWTLVQSGNFTPSSIPPNEADGGDTAHFFPGNRDMGIAVRSKPLAKFFTDLLRGDMALELNAPVGAAPLSELPAAPPIALLQAAPSQPPIRLFKSKRFNPTGAIRVTPVLTPDNYLDVIPGLLASATTSIDIEQQYIRAGQPRVRTLLSSIRTAMDRNPALVVRIIVAAPLGDGKQEAADAATLAKDFGLKLGTHVRILNPRRFVHCHNKLIVVDRKKVLVSSQNWSDSAVTRNREAGLLLESPDLAGYYADIFQDDWDTGLKTVKPSPLPTFAPQALATGKTVLVNVGDYVEV